MVKSGNPRQDSSPSSFNLKRPDLHHPNHNHLFSYRASHQYGLCHVHVQRTRRTQQVNSGQCSVPKMFKTRYVPKRASLMRSRWLTHSARHYSYECKASTQERPYVSRPSRSQQLRNPKLVPQLTSDTPNPLEKKCVVLQPLNIYMLFDI